MPLEKPASVEQSTAPLPIAVPTEAEARAADLEQEENAGGGLRGLSREERIREAAYTRAERRGFEPGHEEDDWLEAECDIDRKDG
ncbi:DUF2934 domain-containing protein [Variovorax sp. J22R24]|uniref:DUF2934 domain-containing protein n=1 Tax=Variovorax gracilis TaxID=3053502 RepID=UPI002577A3F8|nr:DUF2934 domain-containing protein [Variovorax sp. J22R24]MDM0110409.1 DUF2934 domain-containing protein [Variovorax sp. J22R24]